VGRSRCVLLFVCDVCFCVSWCDVVALCAAADAVARFAHFYKWKAADARDEAAERASTVVPSMDELRKLLRRHTISTAGSF
jgi:hypothetical protein